MARKTKTNVLDSMPPRLTSHLEPDFSSFDSSHMPRHVGGLDTGRRAWLVVFGGFINLSASFGLFNLLCSLIQVDGADCPGLLNSFGTFQSEYEKYLGENTSTVTWIGSSQMFVLFLGGIVAGPAFDRWGARKLMLLGTILCFIALIASSFATQFYQFLLAQGFLFGAGCSLLYYPTTSAISGWFDKKRAFALGVVISGASAGGIVWPIVLNQLMVKIGTPWTHRATAAIAIPLLLLSCVLVKEREDVAGPDTTENEVKASQVSISKVIWDARFLGLSSALLVIDMGMMVPFFYIPQYALDHQIESTMANNLLAITYVASLCGRVSTGWIADYMGRFNVLLLISTLTASATLSFIWVTNLPTMVVFSLLFGFFSGGIVPLGAACVAQTTSDMGYIGLRIGAMMAICSVGTLAGGPATGAIKDATGDWARVFVLCAALVFVGTIMLLVVRIKYQKRPTLVF